MENFTYYTPTKVVFGKGTENQTGALVKEQHCKKVLIHYGSGSVVRSGLLDRIKTIRAFPLFMKVLNSVKKKM